MNCADFADYRIAHPEGSPMAPEWPSAVRPGASHDLKLVRIPAPKAGEPLLNCLPLKALALRRGHWIAFVIFSTIF